MHRLRIKNLLLACTVMLVVQFCFPIAFRGNVGSPVAEWISLGAKDAESGSDTVSEVEMAGPFLMVLAVPRSVDTPISGCPDSGDRNMVRYFR